MKQKISRLKSSDDIKRIWEAGKIISGVFNKISCISLEGITTWELDTLIDGYILKKNARAAFKTVWDYNYASCISINNEVVHGIPSKKIKIKNGDLAKVDIGVVFNGFFCDACRTFAIGKITNNAKKLVHSCRDTLNNAIKIMIPGNKLGDIGAEIEEGSKKSGFSVVKNLTGHGIGFSLHEPPLVPHFGTRGSGDILKEGLVLAIEPVFNEGSGKVVKSDGGWAVYTADGLLSAQFEHTVVVTGNGPLILTE